MSYKIILASGSPRRQSLLKELGVAFEVVLSGDDESYPIDWPIDQVPEYLAQQKVQAVLQKQTDALVIGADTIVRLNNQILGKPTNAEEAFKMLKQLLGQTHIVTTGVCMADASRMISFSSHTHVYMKSLPDADIWWYIDKYAPFDKAGAYGIQEWIGMAAVERLEGDYFNVMGLPVHMVLEKLKSEWQWSLPK
jgi:septum formation protein